jgi:hypothetical protein
MATDNSFFNKWNRRDVLKTLGGIPIFGAVVYRRNVTGSLNEKTVPAGNLNIKAPPPVGPMRETTRIGAYRFGIRENSFVGVFATTEWLNNMQEAFVKNPKDTRLADFNAQET